MSDTTTNRLPRVTMGRTVDDLFDKLEEKAVSGTEFVTWYGELYFELHRGTYTTQANNKKHNRKQEVMMHDIEYLATLASLSGKKGYKYPKKEIDEIWENILLCQFHDCLPGSSIEMCYDDSDKLYEHNYQVGRKIQNEALEALGLSSTRSSGMDAVTINTLPWPREDLAQTGETSNMIRIHAAPGLSHHASSQVVSTNESQKARITQDEKSGIYTMSNAYMELKVKDGIITSLYDKRAGREVIAAGGKANQLVVFDDKPLYWQAWDVEVFHLNSRRELTNEKSEIVDDGPERVSLRTKTKISEQSHATTTISLEAMTSDVSLVVVECEVEWHETMKFLKVEFPVDVVNTEANYETQYGIIRRPTHYNTNWDMAKFEVCCHKFADLSEANYGVSILNDSKYGFATCGNLMRLSLLRSPKAPDAHADMGQHHIRWAIMPHSGSLSASTVRAAKEFNTPLLTAYVSRSSSERDHQRVADILSSIQVSGEHSLVLDCVKRGEDDEDVSRGEFETRRGQSIILRIYESLGGRSRGTIRTRYSIKKVYKCNVLEDDLEEVKVSKDGSIEIELRAFEVATYRIQL